MFGGGEIIVIMAVAFLLFGPQKMPEIGRSIGKAMREIQKVREEFMSGIDSAMRDDDPSRKP
ncbi:MAG TPA: twin-arginine translocase TatA/TatE family subunit [Armatimonadota bacterium]|jgi:TatA/E family protein of Tat protein translocase